MRTNLDRELVVKTLNELQNQAKTAAHLGCSKLTLTNHLKMWGIAVNFMGAKSGKYTRPQSDRPIESFEVDEIALWVPLRPRVRCFGLPIATAPVKVRVVRKRTPTGYYFCEVIDSALRIQLSKSGHVINENALHKITNSTTCEKK